MKVISLLINFILLSLSHQDNKIDYLKEAAHWVDIVYKKVYDSEFIKRFFKIIKFFKS
jgi:hypothetical protein